MSYIGLVKYAANIKCSALWLLLFTSTLLLFGFKLTLKSTLIAITNCALGQNINTQIFQDIYSI